MDDDRKGPFAPDDGDYWSLTRGKSFLANDTSTQVLFFFGYRNTFYKECMKEVSKMIIKKNYAALAMNCAVAMIEK